MLDLSLSSQSSSFDGFAIAQIALIVGLLVVVLRMAARQFGGVSAYYGALPRRSWLMILGLFIIISGHLISGAANPTLTIERSVMLFIYLLIGLIMTLSFQRMSPTSTLLVASLAISGMGVGYAVLSAGWFWINGPPAGELCETQIPLFTNVRHTAHFCTPALGIAIFLASSSKVRGLFRVIAAIMAVILWMYIEYTGSRGAVFALCGAALVFAIVVPLRPIFRLVLAALATFAVAMMLSMMVPPAECGSFGLFNRMQSSLETGEVTTGRFEVWKETWDLILMKPIFGYAEIHLKDFTDFTIAQAHNTVLQAILTYGFMGGALYLAMTVEFTLRSLAGARSGLWQVWPLLFALLSMFAYGMIDGTLHHSFSLFVVTFIVAACAGIVFRKPELLSDKSSV